MFGSFARAKDAALEKGLALALRPRLERYGELREIRLDSTAKTVCAEILLVGETEPLRVTEARYRIETEGESSFAVFYGIKVSKPWLQRLLDDHYPEIKVKLPDFARRLLA